MINTNYICDQYRQANPDRRLFLFMHYRQHRPFFENIEKEESLLNNTTEAMISETERLKSPVWRMLRWCYPLFS